MFEQLFASFKNIRVAVVGDTMLDTYWLGSTDRISPEAPVPVVALQRKEYRLGGAGNVALNLASLGAQVSMYTVAGADDDGNMLEQMMHGAGINTAGFWKSAERITTNKIRVVSRNQHLLRIDHEISNDLEPGAAKHFIETVIKAFQTQKPDVVIFEDYNKGVLTEQVIGELIAYCRNEGILTTVDPKRSNFFVYKGVDLFKPNLKEVWEALNILDHSVSLPALEIIHQKLYEKLGHRMSLITLSERGVFVRQAKGAELLPAHIRSIADVSGAGDTVIAVASLVYASTRNASLMAQVANLAGGIVCEEVGTVAIDKNILLSECQRLLVNVIAHRD